MRSGPAFLSAITGLAFMVAACQSDRMGTLLANETTETIEVIWQSDRGEMDLGSVSPGLIRPLSPVFGLDKCSPGTLIVRSVDRTGPEIARRTEPLCYNVTWVVSESGSSRAD
jgi:hypothetical protein